MDEDGNRLEETHCLVRTIYGDFWTVPMSRISEELPNRRSRNRRPPQYYIDDSNDTHNKG